MSEIRLISAVAILLFYIVPIAVTVIIVDFLWERGWSRPRENWSLYAQKWEQENRRVTGWEE